MVDLKEDGIVGKVRFEEMLFNDGVWDEFTLYDVLRARLWCVKVVVLNVWRHPFMVITDNRLEQQFDDGHCCGVG